MTEIRYRRLLALYPRAFRQEYAEEMIGVLMADPRPAPAQVFDLIRNALIARLRLAAPGSGWARSARLVWFFGATLLLTVTVRRVVGDIPIPAHPGRSFQGVVPMDALRLAGWAVALLAAVLGLRLVGALGAVAGLAGEIAAPSRTYLDTPATVLNAYWLIVAAFVVLCAVLVAERGALRPRGWVPIAAAGAVLIAQGRSLFLAWPRSEAFSLWQLPSALLAVAAGLVALGVLRQEAAVRRRLIAWSVPILVTFPLVRAGFGGFVAYNMGHPDSLRLIDPGQWTLLLVVPLAAFAAAAAIIRRLESPA
ncbi:hypothetical protein [Actinoplanes awajinensis]|uniref:Uncharacterized protein n=1 Tax=Actinoplanes awajinensis subsp. mycoplanecinus TaxID=135947 RepID=A0A101JMF4_9ACTN|nr:hypothetical protein [Actinoplanes awajinensis]KUL29506.1 hypothetical protein ADL15_27400 [Actinoplanes awajinensis subsp. mycoplanecinus]